MRKLDELEAEAIRFALTHYRGRMSAMARKLGIGRSTLYRKMKQYGLAPAVEAPEHGAGAATDRRGRGGMSEALLYGGSRRVL